MKKQRARDIMDVDNDFVSNINSTKREVIDPEETKDQISEQRKVGRKPSRSFFLPQT